MKISEDTGKYEIIIDDDNHIIKIYNHYVGKYSVTISVEEDEEFDKILKVFTVFREIRKLRQSASDRRK